MTTSNTPPTEDARSPEPPREPTTRVRQFSGFVVFFKIGWVIACCALLAIAVAGLGFLDNQDRTQWLLLLLGTFCVFPLGWWFLGYIETRLQVLSPPAGSDAAAIRRGEERTVKWMGRVTFLVVGVLSLSGGLICVISEHVFIDGHWKKVTTLNAWFLGVFGIFFGVFCLLALFPGNGPRDGASHGREKADPSS